MSVSNPRNRILLFRLTQDEYAALQAASSQCGARSLSEFARTKLLETEPVPGIEQHLADLKTRVARIESLLEKQ